MAEKTEDIKIGLEHIQRAIENELFYMEETMEEIEQDIEDATGEKTRKYREDRLAWMQKKGDCIALAEQWLRETGVF